MFALLLWTLAAPTPVMASLTPAAESAPRVTVWLDRDDPYAQGDRARVFFRTDGGAYVTIFRVDTDGRVRVVFPREPWEETWVPAGRDFVVRGPRPDRSFTVEDAPGVGYLFAVASADPFDFRDLARDDHWDYRLLADGRIVGDPYLALTSLADRIAWDYDYDIAEYDVGRHYDYPRFLCYDCHSYASYRSWNPYRSFCTDFRIVIYDDPHYYPYRYYRDRPVVITRPRRAAPRYVFKEADRGTDYVSRIRGRPPEAPGRPAEPNWSDRIRRRQPSDPAATPAPDRTRRREAPAQPPQRRQPDTPTRPAPERENPPTRDRRAEPRREAPPPAKAAPASPGRRDEPKAERRPERRGEKDKGDPELRRRRKPAGD